MLSLDVLQDLEFIIPNQADKKSKISLVNKVSGILYPGLMSALVSNPALTGRQGPPSNHHQGLFAEQVARVLKGGRLIA